MQQIHIAIHTKLTISWTLLNHTACSSACHTLLSLLQGMDRSNDHKRAGNPFCVFKVDKHISTGNKPNRSC